MTHSSKIPHFSKRQLLRKGVLNSLLVSALGLYVATTPPTFGAVGGSSEESSSAVTPALSPALEIISDTEKARWLRWIRSRGRSMAMDEAPKSTHDLNSFRDDSVDGWDDFLAQHGPALAAREPYYHAGGAPEPLLKTLQNMLEIAFLIVKDRIDYSSMGMMIDDGRYGYFIRDCRDNWKVCEDSEYYDPKNPWVSTKDRIINFVGCEVEELFLEHGFDYKGVKFLSMNLESLPLDEPGDGQEREGFTAAIEPFLALLRDLVDQALLSDLVYKAVRGLQLPSMFASEVKSKSIRKE